MGSLSDFKTKALLAVVQDEKASGTGGGTSAASTWTTRTLNTVALDPDSIITLSANKFTSSIACKVTWSAPAADSGAHKTRLVKVSDSSTVAVGTSAHNDTADYVATCSDGVSQIEAGVEYRIEHYVSGARGTTGFGVPASASEAEVYTQLMFWG